MKTNNFSLSIAATILLFTVVLLFACKDQSTHSQVSDSYALADSEAPIATCQASWFPHSQTPPPEEGEGSPFDTSSTNNDIFHNWSYQKFLWLTRPQNGTTLFQDEFIQVSAQMVPVTSTIQDVKLILENTGQAGTQGVLISNPKFSASGSDADTVYYAIYVNSTLQNVADSFSNIIQNDISQVNNDFTFPVGSVEVKTSWIKASSMSEEELATYYTSEAEILGKQETVAMLGMHVVGVVKNHPEFIWATFEHHDMAPYYDWAATTNKDVPVTSDDDKLFFAQGYSAGYQDIVYQNNGPQNVFTVYQYGVPRVPGNDFMETSQSEDPNNPPTNYQNIVNINQCVADSLKDVWVNYFYNGSTWANMDGLTAAEQADTIVQLGSNIGNTTPNHILRGSSACFNITMETFTQVDTTINITTASDLTNCFSCHSGHSSYLVINGTTYSGLSPLYMSHIFRSYLGVQSGSPVSEIKKHRLIEFQNDLKNRRLNRKSNK